GDSNEMKDAMTKADIDTRLDLFELALQALGAHNKSVAAATPMFSGLVRKRADLLDALVVDYLSRIATEAAQNRVTAAVLNRFVAEAQDAPEPSPQAEPKSEQQRDERRRALARQAGGPTLEQVLALPRYRK